MSDSALPQGVAAKESRGGSLIEWAIVVCLAASAGAAFEALRPAPPAPDKPMQESTASAPPAQASTIVDLPPIVTNLGAPQDTWVRLKGSVIFDPKTPPHAQTWTRQIGGVG